MTNRVALLLYCDSFESFYKRELGLDASTYLESYRGDWSWDYALGLQENGIDVTIYVMSLNYSGLHETKDKFKVRFIPFKLWYKLIGKEVVSKLYRFGKTPLSPITTSWRELINTFGCFDALQVALEEDNISLLYIQEYWSSRFDFLVERLQIPIIGANHGGNDSLAIESKKRKALPKAYKLTCQTFEETEKVKGYGGDALYLPNGVDADFYCPSPPKNQSVDKTILIVARLTDEQKRISDLIRSLVHLDSTWTLDIAGIGPDLKLLQNLAAQLQVSERVRFLGFVKDKTKLREMYHRCSVYAMPSASEGLPLAALEAMSCGAAVVSSDISAFKQIVRNEINGIQVPVGEPLALAQGILKCYKNRELYGRESRKIAVESHSKKQLFSRLVKIINSAPSPVSTVSQVMDTV